MNLSEQLKIAHKGRKVNEAEVDISNLTSCMQYRKLNNMVLYSGGVIKYFDKLAQFGCMNNSGKLCGICNVGIAYLLPGTHHSEEREYFSENRLEKFRNELYSCSKDELNRFIRLETFCSCMTASSSREIPFVEACTFESECSRSYILALYMAHRSSLKLHGINYARGYINLPDKGKNAIAVGDYMEYVKSMALGKAYTETEVIRADDSNVWNETRMALTSCQPIKLSNVLRKANQTHMSAVHKIYGWQEVRKAWLERCQC